MAMAPSPCPRHVSLEPTQKALPISAARLVRSASIARTGRLAFAILRPSTFTGWAIRARVRTGPALRVTRSSSSGGPTPRALNGNRIVVARSSRLASAARADRGSVELPSDLADLGERPCVLIYLSDRLTPYRTAWEWQREVVALRHRALTDRAQQKEQQQQQQQLEQREKQQRQSEEQAEQEEQRLERDDLSRRTVTSSSSSSSSSSLPPDVLLLVQHPPVYTLGTRSDRANLRFDPTADTLPGGADLFVTERGGEVTYHGPGQLVIYPIVDLRQHRCDLHWYLRSLEEVIIRGVEEGFGIRAGREPGMTGVWAAGSKLAAMGVRVSRWITFHGAALNVTTDLSAFSHIVPCGLTLPVGSVASHLLHHSHAAHPAAAAADDGDDAGAAADDSIAGNTSATNCIDGTAASYAAAEGAAVASTATWQAVEMGSEPDLGSKWEGKMMERAAEHIASAFAQVFSVNVIPLHLCRTTAATTVEDGGSAALGAPDAAVAARLARQLWLPEDLCRAALDGTTILELEVCEAGARMRH